MMFKQYLPVSYIWTYDLGYDVAIRVHIQLLPGVCCTHSITIDADERRNCHRVPVKSWASLGAGAVESILC